MKPASPGGTSLFASDYSLSPNPSPILGRNDSSKSSLASLRREHRPSFAREDILLQPTPTHPSAHLSIVPTGFSTYSSTMPSPSMQSPRTILSQSKAPLEDNLTRAPVRSPLAARMQRKASLIKETVEDGHDDYMESQVPVLLAQQPRPTSAASRTSNGYRDCESCMEGQLL